MDPEYDDTVEFDESVQIINEEIKKKRLKPETFDQFEQRVKRLTKSGIGNECERRVRTLSDGELINYGKGLGFQENEFIFYLEEPGRMQEFILQELKDKFCPAYEHPNKGKTYREKKGILARHLKKKQRITEFMGVETYNFN